MNITVIFLINSILLGVGLAMDAFSVSLANGMNEPRMNQARMSFIAGIFGFFQAAMPMIGWVCVHTIMQYFTAFEKFIPWIALILLCYIGGQMIIEGVKGADPESKDGKLGMKELLIQGVATSIDALSVGFTIAEYNVFMALLSAVIIAAVTFLICTAGLMIGKKFGVKLAGRAGILGGVILVGIGLEILITGVFL